MDVLDGKHNFLSELFLIKFHLKCNRKGGKFLKKLWCWSKISKFCHFIAIYLEKSSKLNLLKEKIEILKRMQYN